MASNDFTLSKKEIAHHFDLATERLMKNKRENWKFIGKLKLIKALVMFEDETKFSYYWTVIKEIFDNVEAAMVLKRDGRSNPNIQKLADIQQTKVVETILAVPKQEQEQGQEKAIKQGLTDIIREKLGHG